MKIYPYEDETVYAVGSKDLGFSQKARATALFKEYNWDAEDLTNENLKKSAISRNIDTCRKLAFFSITTLFNAKTEIDISGFKSIDVDEFDRETRLQKQAEQEVGNFDYRDQFNFR